MLNGKSYVKTFSTEIREGKLSNIKTSTVIKELKTALFSISHLHNFGIFKFVSSPFFIDSSYASFRN